MENKLNTPPKFELGVSSKKEFLNLAISKTYKIFHLIEEEEQTGYSPKPFITGFMFELNAANELFDGKLVAIIVKLKGIKDEYKTLQFSFIKKQIFEICKIINSLLKELEG